MNMPLLSQGMQNIMIGFCFCLGFSAVTIYLMRHRARKQWQIITATSLLGIVILYFIFYTASNMIGRAQVRSTLAKMKALGIPLTPEELMPEPPRNDPKNGALFYKAAFELLHIYDPWNILPVHNHDDISEWSELEQKKAKQVLNSKHMNLVFSLFSRGAKKPYAVYPREFRGVGTLLPPEPNQGRSIFHLVAMKSACDGLEGKTESGYELILDGYRFIDQFQDGEPFITPHMANAACASINTEALNALISKYGISNATAEEFLRILEKLDFNKGMKKGVDGDVVSYFQDVFESIMNGKYSYFTATGLKANDLFTRISVTVLQEIWPFFYQDYAYSLNCELEARTLFDKPYWQVKREVSYWTKPQLKAHMLISKCIFCAYGRLKTKVAKINSEIDAAKLRLALYIFKNKNGCFPEKLEELSPGILKKLPVDPMSGKPFEYKKQGDSFTLDSIWLKEKREKEQKRQQKKQIKDTHALKKRVKYFSLQRQSSLQPF